MTAGASESGTGAAKGGIDVSITVDVEFSLGGTFRPGGGRPLADERVQCSVDGRAWGLPHLMEVLAAHGLKATFFVETLHVLHFGDLPMGGFVERIVKAGHDVQLHLHPQWLVFQNPNWREWPPGTPLLDNCDGRSEAELCDWIGAGVEAFRRWGASAPIALRTGGLRTDRTVYRSMAKMGIPLASNLGWGLFEPTDESLRIAAGRTWIEGVLEVPVVTYRQISAGFLKPLRVCAITSTSRKEQRWLLERAVRDGVSPFVILTHPFEFARFFGQPEPCAPNHVNASRFEALCRRLTDHPQTFRNVTFAGGLAEWTRLPPARFPPMRAPAFATAVRLAENNLNDLRLWN